MNTCKTCKWWELNVKYAIKEYVHKACLNSKTFGNKVWIDDSLSTGYGGKIYTGQNFGCIHHEPIAE